jgi:rhodanese-related sulfurtransferase
MMAKKSVYMKSAAFFIIILAIFGSILVVSVNRASVQNISVDQYPTLSTHEEYQNINVTEAFNMINNKSGYPNLIILDVRTESEYNSGHISGAFNIPVEELMARISELETYNNTGILVYCRTGGRSQQASAILEAQHFTKVYNMQGGITSWTAEGYPTVTTNNTGNQIDFSFNIFLISVFGVVIIIIFKIKFIDKPNKLRK